MNLKSKWKETHWLGKTSLIILVFSAVMIVVYGIFLGWKPSSDSGDWGNFGSYFASITGLLAFSGVLYTASLSEKRADEERGRRKEAEKQAVMRDERDQFFKMLQLYKEQVNSIFFVNPTMDSTWAFSKSCGIEALVYYRRIVKIKTIRYIIYKRIIDDGNIDSNSKSVDSTLDDYVRILKEYTDKKNIEDNLNNGIINFSSVCDLNYQDKDSSSEYLLFDKSIKWYISRNSSSKIIYYAIRYVADSVYSNYEHILGQYFRTICDLQNMVADNIERGKYLAVFRSQLSRSELVLLLYYVVSSQIEPEAAQMFVDNEIFKNIFPEDVLGCKYKVDKEKDKDKKREIINDFIRDLVLIKAEESKKTSKK